MEQLALALHRITARLQAVDMATLALYDVIGRDPALAARLGDQLRLRVAQMQQVSLERPSQPSESELADVRDQAYAETLSRYWAALEPATPTS